MASDPYQPLGRIDPSSLIGRADEDVVSPRATAALADAFRQGFVSTDDIMERVGQRAQLKKKADIMQLEESMSPLAVEARKHSLEAANQEALFNIDMGPAKKEATKAEYRSKWANAQINTSGLAPQAAELSTAAWLPPIPEKGIDEKWQAETIRRWGILQDLKRSQQEAVNVKKAANDPKWFEMVRGDQTIAFPHAMRDLKTIGPAEVEKADEVLRYNHPALWENAGKPSVFGKPGEVTAAPAPATEGAAKPAAGEKGQGAVASAPGSTALAPGSSQPIINVNFGGQPVNPNAKADIFAQSGQASPEWMSAYNVMQQDLASKAAAAPVVPPAPQVVQPAVAAATPRTDVMTAAPAAPAAPLPPGAIVLGPTKESREGFVKMASEQQKGLSQAALTTDQFKQLGDSYATLQKNDAWLTGPVAGRLYAFTHPENWNANYASFERAKTSILANLAKGIYHETGVLSDKDIERYSKALPSVKDKPEAAQAKLSGAQADIWSSIVRNIETMEGQGQQLKPLVQQMKVDAQNALKNLPQQASAASGGAPPISTPGVTLTNPDATGARYYFQNGQFHKVQ